MVSSLLKQIRRYKTGNKQSKKSQPTTVAATVTSAKYFRMKYFFDYCVASLLVLPALPIMAILVVLVRLTYRGPAIYRQCRVGRKGRRFHIYKIRSMRHDAEAVTGPAWTQASDPRVTPLGHFLRKFHLDELPQLFNVLRGEMSLVGPRPERPEFVDVLSRQIPNYSNRLTVLPGITGLAQLNLPPDSDLNSVRRKVILDVEYIQTATLWMDLRLILCTAMRFTKLPILGFFRLQRYVNLPETETETSSSRVGKKVVTLTQFLRQSEREGSDFSGSGSHRRHKINSSRPKAK
jgi:lipopolysaccharide/colanic/teichoic acid biosynthesis glycosyltransferase